MKMDQSLAKTKYTVFDYKNLLDEYISSANAEMDFQTNDASKEPSTSNNNNASKTLVVNGANKRAVSDSTIYMIQGTDEDKIQIQPIVLNIDADAKNENPHSSKPQKKLRLVIESLQSDITVENNRNSAGLVNQNRFHPYAGSRSISKESVSTQFSIDINNAQASGSGDSKHCIEKGQLQLLQELLLKQNDQNLAINIGQLLTGNQNAGMRNLPDQSLQSNNLAQNSGNRNAGVVNLKSQGLLLNNLAQNSGNQNASVRNFNGHGLLLNNLAHNAANRNACVRNLPAQNLQSNNLVQNSGNQNASIYNFPGQGLQSNNLVQNTGNQNAGIRNFPGQGLQSNNLVQNSGNQSAGIRNFPGKGLQSNDLAQNAMADTNIVSNNFGITGPNSAQNHNSSTENDVLNETLKSLQAIFANGTKKSSNANVNTPNNSCATGNVLPKATPNLSQGSPALSNASSSNASADSLVIDGYTPSKGSANSLQCPLVTTAQGSSNTSPVSVQNLPADGGYNCLKSTPNSMHSLFTTTASGLSHANSNLVLNPLAVGNTSLNAINLNQNSNANLLMNQIPSFNGSSTGVVNVFNGNGIGSTIAPNNSNALLQALINAQIGASNNTMSPLTLSQLNTLNQAYVFFGQNALNPASVGITGLMPNLNANYINSNAGPMLLTNANVGMGQNISLNSNGTIVPMFNNAGMGYINGGGFDLNACLRALATKRNNN